MHALVRRQFIAAILLGSSVAVLLVFTANAIPSSCHCSVKSSEPNVVRYNASGQGQPIDHVTYWIRGSGIDLRVFDGAASTWINGAAWNLPGGQTYRLHYREVAYGTSGYTLETDLARCGPVPGPAKVAGKPTFKTNTSTGGLPPAPAVPTATPTAAPATAPPRTTATPRPVTTSPPGLGPGASLTSPAPSAGPGESPAPSGSAETAMAEASASASDPAVTATHPVVSTTSTALPGWLPYALVGIEVLLLIMFLLWDREARRRA